MLSENRYRVSPILGSKIEFYDVGNWRCSTLRSKALQIILQCSTQYKATGIIYYPAYTIRTDLVELRGKLVKIRIKDSETCFQL